MNSTTTQPHDIKADSPFGFIPTLWVCTLFICLFSITTIAHLCQALIYRPRLWWWLPTVVICGVSEIIGWSGRLWGSQNPWSMNPHLMQICTTIFAPSFMTAAMFIVFVRVINLVGPEYSHIRPKIYSYVLVSVDTVALVVQAVGGSKAASADTPEAANQGARVMVGGIIAQMAAITVFAIISAEYFWRVYTGRPVHPTTHQQQHTEGSSSTNVSEKGDAPRMTTEVKQMVFGLVVATILVYARSIYRTIELLDGWGGPIITDQTLFNLLDGVPIVLAMMTLNVFYPGRLVYRPETAATTSV